MWLCEGKLKVKIAHFRLPSASQKRACLSSLSPKYAVLMNCVTCKAEVTAVLVFKTRVSGMPALHVTQSLRAYWLTRCMTSQHLRCHYEVVSRGFSETQLSLSESSVSSGKPGINQV